MFTGIVEHRGRVARVTRRGGGARLEIHAPEVVGGLAPGDSVAVNGACVTVTELNADSFACDLVPETVSRTNLGILQMEEQVNLERPMRMSDRFGGHIVQGHVDAVGVVRSRRRVGAQEVLEITIPFELTRYLAPQGSVALDGVSLTVVAVDKERFRVALIPYTVEMTTLGQKVQGSSVNVEIDVLSKYVERHLLARMARPSLVGIQQQGPGDGVAAPAARPPSTTAAAQRPKKGPPPRAKPAQKPRPPAKKRNARASSGKTKQRTTSRSRGKSTAKRMKAKPSTAAKRSQAAKRTAAKRTAAAKRSTARRTTRTTRSASATKRRR